MSAIDTIAGSSTAPCRAPAKRVEGSSWRRGCGTSRARSAAKIIAITSVRIATAAVAA
jgi:hypothetical protein